jgi:sulfatase modifying factor 1
MRIRRRPLIHGAALVAMAMIGCGGGVTARDQWTVWVTTDAPVPQLADRGLVEVLDATGDLACPDCRRQIGVPTDPSAWPFSFGIAKSDTTSGLRVRVRLYRAANAGADGLPVGTTTLDLVGVLPTPTGNTEVQMVLTAECLGMASDPVMHTSCAGPERALVPERMLPSGRPDSAIRPGTWPRATSVPCARAAPNDMVCIPGGFLVLGDSRALSTGNETVSNTEERYVTLSPFALDLDEVTVGTVRSLVAAGRISEAPTERSGFKTIHAECTYLGPNDSSNDALPVNCITALAAKHVCETLGKRLPTEAEWEWSAGNLVAETRYPWGDIGDPCDFAEVGIGGSPGLETDRPQSTACRVRAGRPTLPAGLPAHRNETDATQLGVRHLAGGVSEWVADRLASYRAGCWLPDQPFLVDPRCDDGTLRNQAVRGSAWSDAPGFVAVVGRQGLDPLAELPAVGFRCARSDRTAP